MIRQCEFRNNYCIFKVLLYLQCRIKKQNRWSSSSEKNSKKFMEVVPPLFEQNFVLLKMRSSSKIQDGRFLWGILQSGIPEVYSTGIPKVYLLYMRCTFGILTRSCWNTNIKVYFWYTPGTLAVYLIWMRYTQSILWLSGILWVYLRYTSFIPEVYQRYTLHDFRYTCLRRYTRGILGVYLIVARYTQNVPRTLGYTSCSPGYTFV